VKSNSELTVSPNPFKNEFLFGASFNEAGKASFRFVDTKGAVIRTFNKKVNKGFNSFTFDKLENLPPGIYVLEVKQENESRKIKLIKIN
jgi:hypothetical protein